MGWSAVVHGRTSCTTKTFNNKKRPKLERTLSSPTVRRYWWHEVTAVPIGDAAQQGEAESGEARPSCGLTASINYFFAPYYRKLSGECLPTGLFP